MNMQVVVRVRPYNRFEKTTSQAPCILLTPSTVSLYRTFDPIPLNYPVDLTIWSNGNDEDLDLKHVNNSGVHDRIGRNLVRSIVNGEDCCLIAYGANATGKSYTLFGETGEKGLIQLSAEEISAAFPQKLTISMVEIYANGLKDLFTGLNLSILPTNHQYLPIKGLSARSIRTSADLEACILLGRRTWAANSTNRMNARSKPSHVLVEFKGKFSGGLEGNLLFVDLAGEERIARAGTPSRETISVNQSIGVLKRAIKGLAIRRNGGKAVLPIRESVLTRVLRRPLEGFGRTVLLATIAPSGSALQENVETLNLCRIVTNRPVSR